MPWHVLQVETSTPLREDMVEPVRQLLDIAKTVARVCSATTSSFVRVLRVVCTSTHALRHGHTGLPQGWLWFVS